MQNSIGTSVSAEIIENSDSNEETVKNYGVIESPGWEFIQEPRNNGIESLSSLPIKYGNNEKDVYSQGSSPTCWAFAGTSLFEYAVDKRNAVINTSFSVEHLLEKTSKVGNCGFTAEKKDGGYAEICAAYFVSGYGPVSANRYPWRDDIELIENYEFGKAEYRATDIMFISAKWKMYAGVDDTTKNNAKKSVYNYGAVEASIWMDHEKYLGTDKKSYYAWDVTSHKYNHNVLIVGWDDNWSRMNFNAENRPESDGAWLVRNSWGSDFGDNGYMWVSYEDPTIRPEMVICDYERLHETDKVYNLDESGRSSDYHSKNDNAQNSTEEGYINVFEIENNEQLNAVTFFESSTTSICQIFYVPIDSNGIPKISEKIALSDEETIEYSGYHTIPIRGDWNLPHNTKCGIMVYVWDEEGTSIGIESTTNKTKGTLNEGESFLCDSSGTVVDMTTKAVSGNFSIKLITENLSTSIMKCTISAIEPQTYSGVELIPKPIITYNDTELIEGIDYILSYAGNLNVGTAGIIVTGIGDYTGKSITTFEINAANICDCRISGIGMQCYTGFPLVCPLVVTHNSRILEEGVDYGIARVNCTYPGNAINVLVGLGNYTGSLVINFTITNDLKYATIEEIPDYVYTGSPISPEPNVLMGRKIITQNEDYVVTIAPHHSNDVGEYRYVIVGMNEYTGSQTVTYNVVPANISNTYVYGNAVTYTGYAINYKPRVKYNDITLTEETDYTVTCSNNINVGKGRMQITGLNNFTGTRYLVFTIQAADISKATVSNIATQKYTGSMITPKPTLTFNGIVLVEGTDYDLSYSNNINLGTATVIITGKGNFTGSVNKTFTITN